MQPLQQELDPVTHELTPNDHPVLRGLMADQATAHAEEVRLLRQRVAVLESALTAATANAAAAGPTPQRALRVGTPASEFVDSAQPAVMAAAEAAPAPASPSARLKESDAPLKESDIVPDQGFAEAWSDDDESSFEERLAQKAFFQVGSVDEPSRTWLLTS